MGFAQAGTFNKPMVEQVNASLTAAEPKWLPIGGAPTQWGTDLATPEKRLAAAVKLAGRTAASGSGGSDGGGDSGVKGGGVVAVVDQSDDAWSDASNDPDIAELLNDDRFGHSSPGVPPNEYRDKFRLDHVRAARARQRQRRQRRGREKSDRLIEETEGVCLVE